MKGRTRFFKTTLMFILMLVSVFAIVACVDNTDSDDVAEAKAALAIDLKDNNSITNVKTDIGLPTTGLKDVTVTWTTSKSSVVTTGGLVTRTEVDETVTLTASLKKGDASDSKKFTVVVIKLEPQGTPAEAIDALAITGDTLVEDGGSFTTTGNVVLPTSSLGHAVNWESSNSEYISETGEVTRPEYGDPNALVILTAFIGSEEKDFIVSVLAIVDMPVDTILATASQQLLLTNTELDEDITLPKAISVEATADGDDSLYQTTVTWESKDTTLISNDGVINRPDFGEDPGTVVITATINFNGTTVTKDFSLVILALEKYEEYDTLREAEVGFLEVFTSTDPDVKQTRHYAKIKNVTLIGRMEDGLMFVDSEGNPFFAFGSLSNAYHNAELGKRYDIIGLLADYFGVTQINGTGTDAKGKPTALFEADGEPYQPVINNVSSIKDYLADTMPVYGNDNRFLMEYLRVEAKIYVKDNSSYGVFIVDKDYDGDYSDIEAISSVPYTDEAIVIYYTSNKDALIPFNGLTVTLDVVMYGLRNDKNIYNAVFLGDMEDVVVNLTDAEAVNAAKAAAELELPSTIVSQTNITLLDEMFGASLEWVSSHPEIIGLDGLVTPKAGERVPVTLTATITKGEATETLVFEITVGELPVLTVSGALAVAINEPLVVKGTLVAFSANNTIVLHDETGAIAVFIGGNVISTDHQDLLKASIGKVVIIEGSRTSYNGLEQVQHIVKVEVTNEAPFVLKQDITDLDWTAEALKVHQGKSVSITGGTIDNVNVDSNNNVAVTIKLGEKTIVIRWDSRVPVTGTNTIINAVEGDLIDVVDAPLGWNQNNPQIGYSAQEHIVLTVNPDITKHEVKFMNGAEVHHELEAVEGRAIAEFPANPTKDGHLFDGWWNEDFSEEWLTTDLVTADLVLHAKWIEGSLEETVYSFASLTQDTSYVLEPTQATVSGMTFTRLNANISTVTDFETQGIVLAIRKDNNWGSPYLQIDEKLTAGTQVSFNVINWTRDASNNLEAFASGIYLQTSTDGETWVDGTNFKSTWDTGRSAANVLSLTLESDAFVRLFVRSAGTQDSSYNLRLSVLSIAISKFVPAVEYENPVTVTVMNGTDELSQKTFESGETFAQPDNLVEAQRNFIGWALEGETDLFDFEQAITEDITLVAVWEEAYKINLEEIFELEAGVWVEFTGVVTGFSPLSTQYNNHDYVYLQDLTGATNVYRVSGFTPTVGEVYTVVGNVDIYQGFYQIKSGTATVTKVEDSELTVPAVVEITDIDSLTKYEQSTKVSFDAVVKSLSTNGRELTVTLDDKDIMVRTAGNSGDLNNHFLQFNGGTPVVAGQKVSLVGVYVGWSNDNPRLLPYYVEDVVFTEFTDAVKLAAALDDLELQEVYTTEATLPVTGLYEVTIAWVADPAANLVDGTFVLPEEGDVEVTLTATLTLGELTETKEFTVTLRPAGAVPTEPVVLRESDFGETDGWGAYSERKNQAIENGANDPRPTDNASWDLNGGNVNNSGWDYIRMGGKAASTKEGLQVYLKTNFTFTEMITEINIDIVALDSAKGNETIWLQTSTNGTAWTDVTSKEITAIGELKFTELSIASGNYFRFVIVRGSTGSNNRGTDIKTITFIGM